MELRLIFILVVQIDGDVSHFRRKMPLLPRYEARKVTVAALRASTKTFGYSILKPYPADTIPLKNHLMLPLFCTIGRVV